MIRILWQFDSRNLKQFCPEKCVQNILKHNGRRSNSTPPYWTHKNQSNWRWTLREGELTKHIKPQKTVCFPPPRAPCCAQNDMRTAKAFTSVSMLNLPMLRPERNKIPAGFHKCLGSRRPVLCPERSKIFLGFHKCLGSRRPMLCPERNKIRLGFHKCLGSRRPMLCPKRN